MARSPLEAVVRHEGRLDVMCCLDDEGPLGVKQLIARTGKPRVAVDHHLKLLNAIDLVNRIHVDGDAPLYELTLDDHPDWVREAVEEHRHRD